MPFLKATNNGSQNDEIVALFRGPLPGSDATVHYGRLIASYGGDIGEMGDHDTGHPLFDHDRIVELDIPSVADGSDAPSEALWLLIRSGSLIVNARILVVEDSEMNGLYYQDVLTGAGADVEHVTTGAETLEVIERREFDLALVDVRLPDANGYELCQMLRSAYREQGIRILLMSADPTTLDPKQVTSVGASGFVINPIRPDELTKTVTAALALDRANIISPAGTTPSSIAQQTLLRLFGRPALWSPTGWVDLRFGRSAEILATLAAACPHGVPAERLSELVWDRNLAISSNAMYTAISRLRRQLADTSLEEAVVTDGLGYRLDVDPGSIDLVNFEIKAKALMSDSSSTVEQLRDLLELWTGDPFHSTNNDLLLNWRHRLRELRAQALEALAVRLTVSSRASEAIGLCRDLVTSEPWRESSWSLLIVALYRAGQPEDSLVAYRAAVNQLREDLGLDPGPGLGDLETKVLNHDPDLLDDNWIMQIASSLNRRPSST